jgi:hypothetical protein
VVVTPKTKNNMSKQHTLLKGQIYKLYLLAAVIFALAAGTLPFLLSSKADAISYGQIANRSLTISSGVPGKTGVTYTFSLKIPDTSQIEGMKFIACTTAVSTYPGNTGSCAAPTGFSAGGGGFSGVAFGTQNGFQGAASFAVDATGANDCQPSAVNHNIICINRTDTTTQTANEQVTVSFTNIKNPTTNNYAFYVGAYTYSDNAYTAANLIDFGATATAVTQTLTTQAAVAEVLQFCVGATTVDGVDTPVTDLVANDCSGVSGTTVDIGTLDTSVINISPISTDGGNGNNGVAMVRSNAGNGVAVSYDAIQAATGTNHLGALRISGQTCNTTGDPGADANGNTLTDPCINSNGWNATTGNATQSTLTAGTESFGMTIAGVNSLGTSSYTCAYGDAAESVAAGNSCHLEPASNYLGDGGSGTEIYGTANGFAWDEDGSSTLIASSAGSTVKQVDDEALIVKFAATPSITTPFGRYAVQTDFTAVPTY